MPSLDVEALADDAPISAGDAHASNAHACHPVCQVKSGIWTRGPTVLSCASSR